MQILISASSDSLTRITEYFSFNQILWQHHDFFDPELDFGRYTMPSECSHTLAVMTPLDLHELLDWQSGRESLVAFCQRRNQIWITQDHDVIFDLVRRGTASRLLQIDNHIAHHGLQIMGESLTTDHNIMNQFQNTLIRQCPNWFLGQMPRITGGSWKKSQSAKPFMVTMIKRRRAPHRALLHRALQCRSRLAQHGTISFRTVKKQQWIGERPHQHDWFDGHPSMDLYRECLIELVPETMYRDAYYATEKTNKPMATHTAFMVVSTMGYLQYLKNQGFRTFDTLIDESYDQQHRVEDRIQLMLEVLEDVIDQGARDFYDASKDILEHNYQRLCELAGGYAHAYDSAISRAFDQFCEIDQ